MTSIYDTVKWNDSLHTDIGKVLQAAYRHAIDICSPDYEDAVDKITHGITDVLAKHDPTFPAEEFDQLVYTEYDDTVEVE